MKADLAVTGILVNRQPPDGKNDCQDGKNDVIVAVKNEGKVAASKVGVQLAVDGDQAATKLIAALKPGESGEVAFDDVRLKKGQHTLTATLQAPPGGAEASADTNALKVTATCTADN